LILKEAYFISGKAYLILRKVQTHVFTKNNILNRDKLNLFKEWCGADHVLKTQSHFIFVETIEEADYEEITDIEDEQLLNEEE
tara:strand:+ start:258 stop:506 length:249 start_codon:yes stop_codon:yes gene_type:complete